ncbi:MAG: tRNA (adenosine(37)-N6)-dimethylallyltransferase MiaA [Elusimicrobia bacterium]|nr:tRNA (adenosine(37)-N6)-dimethylallyltransferase MiaA [Elusimicrobiota bacterium]
MTRVVAVVGPTASGKTELAVALARSLGGEVVSADSRQLYRGFDAGTAKPRLTAGRDADGIPHHLIDAADPSETVSAGRYARMAGPVLEAIVGRGRVPIVAGGTGLYIRALLDGLSDLPEADQALRSRISEEARTRGWEALHRRLAEFDPEAAARIPKNNRSRLMRALEVRELTGRPISSFWKKGAERRWETVYLSIVWPPDRLRARIVDRAQAMWPGILDETRRHLERWTGLEAAFQSLGYREALSCLEGRITADEGLALLIRATTAYAKRQRTWFKNQLPAATRVEGGPTQRMLDAALRMFAHGA